MDVITQIREELTVRPSDEQIRQTLEDRLGSIASQKQSIQDRAANELAALDETARLLEDALASLAPQVEVVEQVTEEAQG